MDMDFDGSDGFGHARFKVWHPDNLGRVVYITVDGALSPTQQRKRAQRLARSDPAALDWRNADDSG